LHCVYKSMRATELRELSTDDLNKRNHDLRLDLLNFRVQKATGQVENLKRGNELRKEIARIETVLTERKKAAAATEAK
jgi:large subunit ribosomal protein L29